MGSLTLRDSQVQSPDFFAMAGEHLGDFRQEGGTVRFVLWEDLSDRCIEEASGSQGHQGASDETRA